MEHNDDDLFGEGEPSTKKAKTAESDPEAVTELTQAIPEPVQPVKESKMEPQAIVDVHKDGDTILVVSGLAGVPQPYVSLHLLSPDPEY